MPSSFNIVQAPTDEVYYVPSFKSGDVAYYFRKSGTRYLALERQPNHSYGVNDFPVKPAIFSSPDGVTWTLEDSANTVEGPANLGPAYDCRFDGSASVLTCFFDAARDNVSMGVFDFTCYLADFDFSTHTWSTRGELDILSSPSMSRSLFSSRPDGKYVVVINQGGSAKYAIYDPMGGWSGFTTIAAGSCVALLVASDNVMHVNVAGNHYAIDTSGSVLSSEAMPFGQGPMRVKNGALTMPALDGSTQLAVATGTPPNAAVWSTELVDAESIFGGAVLVTENPSTGVDIAFTYDNTTPSPHTEIETGVIHIPAAASVLAMYWITNDSLDIMRSQRVAGVWSAPASVFTSAGGFLSILGIPDSAGGVGARYFVQ